VQKGLFRAYFMREGAWQEMRGVKRDKGLIEERYMLARFAAEISLRLTHQETRIFTLACWNSLSLARKASTTSGSK